jgi:hypothetical protein
MIRRLKKAGAWVVVVRGSPPNTHALHHAGRQGEAASTHTPRALELGHVDLATEPLELAVAVGLVV